jgi:hypothetical protein
MSGAETVEWSENAALLEKRANSAEKQVTSSTYDVSVFFNQWSINWQNLGR